MYLSHTVRTKKKVEKEMPVISIPGSKTFTAAVIVCCMALGMMLGAMVSQRQRTVSLYEKKLEKTVSEINERNAVEINSSQIEVAHK